MFRYTETIQNNSKLLHGQTQNEEMQEIQTEATIAMFRDTDTIQNNSKLLHGQTQNEEMQEIQTEATIAMFRDTETIQTTVNCSMARHRMKKCKKFRLRQQSECLGIQKLYNQHMLHNSKLLHDQTQNEEIDIENARKCKKFRLRQQSECLGIQIDTISTRCAIVNCSMSRYRMKKCKKFRLR